MQAVAAWCENFDFDLDLDPVFACLLGSWLMRLGRPCNAWLTTRRRLASVRLLRQLLLNHVSGGTDESGEVAQIDF